MIALWDWLAGPDHATGLWRRMRRLRSIGAATLFLMSCKSFDASTCLGPDAPDECEPSIDEPPAGTLTCDLYAVEGSATGVCVPYVDAGWHVVLARFAYLPKSQLRCTEEAPNPGLAGVEIRDDGMEPRNVIGCSVNPLSTCPSPGLACVPFDIDYPACITQSGDPAPPCDYEPYTQEAKVMEDGSGRVVTICCRKPETAG